MKHIKNASFFLHKNSYNQIVAQHCLLRREKKSEVEVEYISQLLSSYN